MTITATEVKQEHQRVLAGLQCPECFGVNIGPRADHACWQPKGFECKDCGCWWDQDVYPRSWK